MDPSQNQPPIPQSTIVVSPPPEPPGEKPGDVIGRYKLLEKIGEGGMGTVWIAEQRQELHRKVALKVIKLGMDTRQVIARFEAERQALALMDHPGIARVLDAGATENGRPFFVMELVNGIPITDYCDRHQLAPAQRLALFMKVCKALQHAHSKGIVHRDIKPENVMLRPDGYVKVLDFGLAKSVREEGDAALLTLPKINVGDPLSVTPSRRPVLLATDAEAGADLQRSPQDSRRARVAVRA
jgi:serine/threonine protein kinase